MVHRTWDGNATEAGLRTILDDHSSSDGEAEAAAAPNVPSWPCLRLLHGHTDAVAGVSWNHQGNKLATARQATPRRTATRCSTPRHAAPRHAAPRHATPINPPLHHAAPRRVTLPRTALCPAAPVPCHNMQLGCLNLGVGCRTRPATVPAGAARRRRSRAVLCVV